ncbi:MAG: DUF5684 domain-containing protein [Clostridium sp.]|nr:DUF5684 domain-containing protein [Clostridium sp.]
MEGMLGFIYAVLVLVSEWKVYQKMGRKGWEGIIPIYNVYVLFKVLYGNGWRFLLLLIPIYDIYLTFKANIDLAHGFHKSTGFGVGLTLITPIFNMILGFGDAVYGGDEQAAE